MSYPRIIQGGMGVAVSSWQLANQVSRRGQLGVVSGTGISLILISRLMEGDPNGDVHRALAHFPFQDVVEKLYDKYYIEGGSPERIPYKRATMWTHKPPKSLNELTVVSNFMEVWLAKEGHNNPVGINLLEKVQLPNPSSIYGAMLAGVDYLIMGAGIPMQIPGILDKYVNHEAASYPLDVKGASAEDNIRIHFDPEEIFPGIAEKVGPLKRPKFLPIVSSVILAMALRKRANGEINGFVIEMPTAGGHNAPPRIEAYNDKGEPVYGAKDEVKFSKFTKFGLPFWLAGGYGNAEGLQEALDYGAQGIQVGTAFAYTDESGFSPEVRQKVIGMALEGEARVFTDAVASPTGFPFKVVEVAGTVWEDEVYEDRVRICDIGYLRHLYKRDDGKIGYRCPSEPQKDWARKGGDPAETVGRKCLCNHLGAAAGYPQLKKNGKLEPSIITSGDDLPQIIQFIREGKTSYDADDVLRVLLGETIPEEPVQTT